MMRGINLVLIFLISIFFLCYSGVYQTGVFFIDDIQHLKIINVKIVLAIIVCVLMKGRQLTLFIIGAPFDSCLMEEIDDIYSSKNIVP